MIGRSGEVAVKRDGHVHAVAAPELSGPISVDVDAEHVQLPPGAHVSFQDPDRDAADDDAAEEAATDGGATPTRSEIELRGGLAMSEHQSEWAVGAAAVALLVAGYLWGGGDLISALAVGAAGGLLGWFGLKSLVRWREVDRR
jgi:hypothetical protein